MFPAIFVFIFVSSQTQINKCDPMAGTWKKNAFLPEAEQKTRKACVSSAPFAAVCHQRASYS